MSGPYKVPWYWGHGGQAGQEGNTWLSSEEPSPYTVPHLADPAKSMGVRVPLSRALSSGDAGGLWVRNFHLRAHLSVSDM